MIDSTPAIRLLVFDVDGVLTAGEAQTLDLDLMNILADMNRRARRDPEAPAATVCTGRPAPYVDALMQAMDAHVPGVFENGAGLYVPASYRFHPHPALAGNEASFQAAKQRLAETLVRDGRAYFQPGKEYTLSLFASDPIDKPRLLDWSIGALGPLHREVDLSYSASCMNMCPLGIDKAAGLHFLAETSGYRPAEMLGAGDSDVDLPFLRLTGFSAAPVNANAAVKEIVQYVAPRPTSLGVRDILAHFGL